jgi:hypothetical protein
MVKRAKTDRGAHFQTALTEDSAERMVSLWLRIECNCIEPVYDRQLEEACCACADRHQVCLGGGEPLHTRLRRLCEKLVPTHRIRADSADGKLPPLLATTRLEFNGVDMTHRGSTVVSHALGLLFELLIHN